jgi:site-specific recombinase XerD
MPKQAESPKMSGKIAEFFDVLGNKSPSTISGYKSAIWSFFQFVLKLTDAEKQTYSPKVDAYFESHDSTAIYQDFKAFLQSPECQNKAPKGALQTFNQVFNFFALSDVVLSGKQRTILMNQLPTGGVISEETNLSREMLKQMLAHSDVKGRAILLTLASSGMRIGELLKLKCSDVHKPTKEVPAMWFNIAAKNTKNGTSRHTFCSTEAQIAVEEWIKVRPQYIEENKNRGTRLISDSQMLAGMTQKPPKDAGDNRLFPMSESSVAEMLADLVTKVTGENAKDANTGRSMIHAHGFRKFFVSKLADSVEMGIINLWAGHLTNLDKTYLKKTPEETVKLYLKGEINLYIEADENLVNQGIKNDQRLNEIRDNELQSSMRINRLENEKADLAAQVKKQAKDIEELHAMFAETLAILKDRQERDRA